MPKLIIVISIIALPQIIFGQAINFPKITSLIQPKHISKTSKQITSEERQVQYIGNYRDTIYLLGNGFDIVDKYKISAKEGRYLYSHPFYADSGIKILIDTAQILGVKETMWKGKNLLDIVYDAYPVTLQNNTDTTAIVGFGRRIPVVLEALDIDNKWKPIEKPYIYKCGTGLRNILLKPHDIICVLVPKYKGVFKTQLRLRLRNNISMPFYGEINRSQFLEK